MALEVKPSMNISSKYNRENNWNMSRKLFTVQKVFCLIRKFKMQFSPMVQSFFCLVKKTHLCLISSLQAESKKILPAINNLETTQERSADAIFESAAVNIPKCFKFVGSLLFIFYLRVWSEPLKNVFMKQNYYFWRGNTFLQLET